MTSTRPTSGTRRLRTILVSAAAGIVLAGSIAFAAGAFDGPDRQQLVADRGGEVMPFDLDATTHYFEPSEDGGLETVLADDPSDSEQIELIQQHLREEAAAFARGEFDDPAQIHGEDMPGLATLEAKADEIGIEYFSRDDGAEIRFTTDDPILVTALHDWFAAQTSDHGAHAD